jgi:hypothetical protein
VNQQQWRALAAFENVNAGAAGFDCVGNKPRKEPFGRLWRGW